MARNTGTKINRLLKSWPAGTVAASSWLESQGVYHQLASDYEKNAWIEHLGHGAFVRSGDRVDWLGGVYALQRHLELPVHVGARSALALQGIVHFVHSGQGGHPEYLFGPPQLKLPLWFKKYNWNVILRYTATNLFLSTSPALGLTEKNLGGFSVRISSRERAILELLHLVPKLQSYEEAKLLFEGLRTLRSSLLQQLLESCHSIKVKRLFFHFADQTSQPWLAELDLSKIDLGKGKRVIDGGGIFDSKYNISVPKIHTGEPEQGLEGP